MNWLVDDQHLGMCLRTGRRPAGTRRTDGVFTTGLWYVRLCQAALVAGQTRGVLSAPCADLGDAERSAALEALMALPPEIGLLSLRDLAPSMGRLRNEHRLNALASEAVAASLHLEAKVLLAATTPRLEAALGAEGRSCVVRTP
jgi:hypothetical protein